MIIKKHTRIILKRERKKGEDERKREVPISRYNFSEELNQANNLTKQRFFICYPCSYFHFISSIFDSLHCRFKRIFMIVTSNFRHLSLVIAKKGFNTASSITKIVQQITELQ